MEVVKEWVALLDEDEEDYVFWQYGFQAWAIHLDLHWFSSLSAFLSATALGKSTPVALVMDGVIPRGEETNWLSTLLLHPSCRQSCMIMLSGELKEQEHQLWLNLGATDHLLKPTNLDELKTSVLTVSRHISARGMQ